MNTGRRAACTPVDSTQPVSRDEKKENKKRLRQPSHSNQPLAHLVGAAAASTSYTRESALLPHTHWGVNEDVWSAALGDLLLSHPSRTWEGPPLFKDALSSSSSFPFSFTDTLSRFSSPSSQKISNTFVGRVALEAFFVSTRNFVNVQSASKVAESSPF